MKFIFTCTILASITTSLLAADQEGTQNVSSSIATHPDVLIQLVWIAVITAVAVLVSITTLGVVVFFRSQNPADSFSLLFERAQALKLMTVIAIVAAVTLLALVNAINSNGAVGVLSGIAGYVLGGIEGRRHREEAPRRDGNTKT